MMIYIQVINRYWNPGAKLLKGYPNSIRLDFEKYIADEYVRLVKISIDQQRYRNKWKDLTPGYLEYKRKHGLSTNIWEATGQLKSSLKVMRKGYRNLEIGFDKRAKHRGSKTKLYMIAKYLEYGTLRMPPRPLFRTVYIYMSSNISYFWEKFLRDGGD